MYQLRKPENRDLVDVRPVEAFPPVEVMDRLLVMAPAELIASKVTAFHSRKQKPKAGSDWRDTALLLLPFPELKSEAGAVRDRLQAAGVEQAVFAEWDAIVARKIEPEDDDDGF